MLQQRENSALGVESTDEIMLTGRPLAVVMLLLMLPVQLVTLPARLLSSPWPARSLTVGSGSSAACLRALEGCSP